LSSVSPVSGRISASLCDETAHGSVSDLGRDQMAALELQVADLVICPLESGNDDAAARCSHHRFPHRRVKELDFWHFCHCLIPGISPHARRVRACEADLGGGSASLMTSACAESPLIHCGAASQEAHLYAHLRGVVPLCAAGIRLRAGIAAGVQGMLVTVRSSMYADYDKSIVLRLPASQARSSRRSLVQVVAVIRLTYTDSGRADERTRTADLLIRSEI
jgi:hypothetical protein